jgi:hypothetical protein
METLSIGALPLRANLHQEAGQESSYAMLRVPGKRLDCFLDCQVMLALLFVLQIEALRRGEIMDPPGGPALPIDVDAPAAFRLRGGLCNGPEVTGSSSMGSCNDRNRLEE